MKQNLHVFNFSIQNASEDAVDIHIDGDIVDASTQELLKSWFGDETSVSFKSFRDAVNQLNANTLNVYINSGGGHVGDAMAIHDLIVDMQAKGKTVNTIGRGIVASAATYILLAGNTPEMSENSWFMIHNVSGAIWGDVNMIENYASTLRKFNDATRDFYSKKTGSAKEVISRMMNSETWMTAADAKEKGFIQKVSGEVSFSNAIPKETWQFSNMAVLNAYNSAVKPADNSQSILNDMKKLFNDFKTTISNAINGVKPAEGASQQDLVNQIAEAVGNSFAGLGEQFEAEVNTHINNTIAGADFQATLATAVTAAVNTATAELKEKNEALETEITNMKGGATNAGGDGAPKPKVQGTWN